MGRRRAEDNEILAAAERALKNRHTVTSQRRMAHLVNDELGKADGAAVTGERVRRLLAVAAFCQVDVKTREGPAEKVLHACPVCASRLQRVKNQTLFGGEVTLTLRCSACGYWTGKKKRVPTLYVFHYRAPK